MTSHSLILHSDSPDETCHLARQFAAQSLPGDVLLLSGDVGAGKTHFARCFIQSVLSSPEDVPSPTYTLVQTYTGTTGEIWHADLYRLSDTSEIEELGLSEAFSSAICLIEWPDRLGDAAPASALSVALGTGTDEQTREIRFNWASDRWTTLLKGLFDE